MMWSVDWVGDMGGDGEVETGSDTSITGDWDDDEWYCQFDVGEGLEEV